MLLVALALSLLIAAVTGAALYASVSSQLPDPDVRKARGRDQSTVITDRNGKTLVRLFAEQNRQDVALEKIPEHMRDAIVATEDKRFYEHEGVDPLGIARALVVDVMRGDKSQGGSTITQQYVKQAFVTPEKTLKRKVQEAILAQRVEDRYSKDEILELYLNTIYFGHGAYGVEAASRVYFGKGVGKLTIDEAAVLAGVIKAPSHYSPYVDPERSKNRRDTILGLMLAQEYISQQEHDEAVAAPLDLTGLKAPSTRAPYFVEWVKEELVKKYGQRAVYRGGLRIKTTLDPVAQKAAEKAIAQVLDEKGDPSAAIVAIKPDTGEVVAMVGGSNFEKQQYNVAVQGRRQPGSAFKPFVLVTALSEGISPEAPFESGARSFPVGTQTWKVTGGSGGPMRLRTATEKSINSVYAQLILDVGAEDVVETAEKLGIGKGIEPVPAIALGGLEHGVSPLEMARAYATLAAGGSRPTPFGITHVKDANGETLEKAKPKSVQVIEPAIAYLATDILKGVISRGTGGAANIGRPAAGKTGTTQQYRDAWFVGYTPDLVTAVWVGYPDAQREMKSVHGRNVTGGSFPAEIWARFMRAALADTKATQFKQPSGLTKAKVCSETGGLVTEFCPEPVSGLFLAGKKPDECEEHQTPTEVDVPKLVGISKVDALAKIEKAYLVAKVVEREVPGVEAGKVASQKPAAGRTVKADTTVTIVVSTGGSVNQPPVAAFTAPESAAVGESVDLDATSSADDGSIKKYYWEFGDGATGTGKTVVHSWSAPGPFEITLWVTDDKDLQSSVTKVISIR